MNYKTLYLKYKFKYLKLKKLLGGNLIYEEDSKNIHKILKSIFENEISCNKIRSKIYNILDPSMKITFKIIMDTDCTTIKNNVNSIKLVPLIDNTLKILITVYNTLIINKKQISSNDASILFSALINLFGHIFGLNSRLVATANLFLKQIISIEEINMQFSLQNMLSMNESINELIKNYNQNKILFTNYLSSCIVNYLGNSLSSFVCTIPGSQNILRIIQSLNLKQPQRVNPSLTFKIPVGYPIRTSLSPILQRSPIILQELPIGVLVSSERKSPDISHKLQRSKSPIMLKNLSNIVYISPRRKSPYKK